MGERKSRGILAMIIFVLISMVIPAGMLKADESGETKTGGACLHFDASKERSTGKLLHGSTGFLYGVSEPGVPSANLIQAISPKILVQKAADGRQHPSGDAYRLTPFLRECGVENIQVYIQDYYLEWPYEYNGIDDYSEKVKMVVNKMVKGKSKEELSHYSFVLFNEPDMIWYGNNISGLCRDWLKIYKTVKDIDPDLKVAGPNYSLYDSNAYKTFFEFCRRNECLPEYITWHELQKGRLGSFAARCAEVKDYINTYYAGSGIEPDIFINETVNFSDLGNPGALVGWLSVFEEQNVYASLPFWGLANSLNELAADTNKPNGAWWVYKWYAQMSGDKMPLTAENTKPFGAYGGLYGLASADDEARVVYSLFGGQAGNQTVSIENICSAQTFKDAKSAYVKIYRTKYTGQQGFADTTPLQFEGNISFTGDDLVFTVPDAELTDAYFAVIMPAKEGADTTIAEYTKNWEKTYEAENARMIGAAQKYEQTDDGALARSNRYDAGNMNTENDGVEFTVNVPYSGRYRMNIYYSSQAPQTDPLTLEYVDSGGQNRAVGALSRHTLSVDGGPKREIVYDSTVKWGYYNYKTIYVDLFAGRHNILLMYKGDDQNIKEFGSMLCATLDKIDLVYEPGEDAVITAGEEEFLKENEETGGYDFYVCAPRGGYYKAAVFGEGNVSISRYKVNYAKDAKAESDISISRIKLFDISADAENGGYIYLAEGINHLYAEGDGITGMTFTEDVKKTEEEVVIKEAEDCELSGTQKDDGYDYLFGSAAAPEVIETKYASKEKAVEGFRGGSDNKLVFNVDVPKAGDYVLLIRYSNNEPAPVMTTQYGEYYVHPYNTDLVERYAQVRVNEDAPQTVYCRNTLCWDTYKDTVIDVVLKEGTNTITVSNDNSYKFSSLQDDFTPRFDNFEIAPAKIYEEEPAVTEKPDVTDKPAATEKPEETETPAATEKPAAADKPGAADKPEAADSPDTADNPKATDRPDVLGNPVSDTGNVISDVGASKRPGRVKILKVKLTKKKILTVKWKKDAAADGYELQYALKKKLRGKVKTVGIKKGQTAKIKIKKLKAGRKYYIRMRAYKAAGKGKVYGKWSKITTCRQRG